MNSPVTGSYWIWPWFFQKKHNGCKFVMINGFIYSEKIIKTSLFSARRWCNHHSEVGADVLSESPCRRHAVSLCLFSFSRDDNAHQTHTAVLSDRPTEQTGSSRHYSSRPVSLLAASRLLSLFFLFTASKQYFTAPVKLLLTLWHLFMAKLKLTLRAGKLQNTLVP